MGPFGIEFLQKITIFCFPGTEFTEQNARQVFNLLESLAIAVPDTDHWWTTAPGAVRAFNFGGQLGRKRPVAATS